jgi:hypothetical protein
MEIQMLGLRLSATTLAISFAVASLTFSAPAFAKSNHHHHHHRHHGAQVELYGDVYSSYGEDNEAVFPNTEDYSAECINGYRWQRHNHDWYKTEAQDSLPLPCN